MKNYFVMGYQPEKNMIQNIVSVAYFVEELSHCKNYENYPFYQNKGDLSTFKSLMLVTKEFKKYTFDILSDDSNTYVVSSKFLNILKSFKIKIKHIIPLVVVEHRNHDLRLENQFFYIQIETDSYKDVVDLAQSDLEFDYPDSIAEITKLELKNSVGTDFILIDEFHIQHQTPICSLEFKEACEQANLRGIKFFSLEKTPWMKGDIMDNYFAELLGTTTAETLKRL